jgi:hypothetical protein
MRFMALVFVGMLAVCVMDSQAFAARRGNPDETYYQGAGSCNGAAYCAGYRGKKVHRRPHS